MTSWEDLVNRELFAPSWVKTVTNSELLKKKKKRCKSTLSLILPLLMFSIRGLPEGQEKDARGQRNSSQRSHQQHLSSED